LDTAKIWGQFISCNDNRWHVHANEAQTGVRLASCVADYKSPVCPDAVLTVVPQLNIDLCLRAAWLPITA
jgi:hypothetical protein